MGVRIEPRAEPIPGYKLIERLGGGGFGEVWKAEAPGGLFKAIKFVYGDLQMAGDDGCRAEQELKGLSRVKSVHHPYILSLERYDIIDGQLIIVMELADRTIWDRFQECRGQGLPGIPRGELLDCLRETAEALDLMNIEYQLQHLDIKPQNLFLSHNHIKVADFGLVKDLEGMNGATVTGGVTPVYAAPETFDGRISRFSDQYSLAIVYQELLTGVRPFAGTTMRQLVLQHIQGTPDVASLPMADRPPILRALSKNPDDRFPSCAEMIKALGDAKGVVKGPVAPQAFEKEKERDKVVPKEDLENTRRSKKDRPMSHADFGIEIPPEMEEALKPKTKTPNDVRTPANNGRDVAQIIADVRAKHRAAHPLVARPSDQPAAAAPDAHAPGAAPLEETGILQPAVVIGLGQMGTDTLRQLRRLLNEEFGMPEALPHVRLIALDTDPEAMQAAGQGEPQSRLRPSETLHTSLRRPSHYLKGNDGKSVLDGWLDTKMIYRIPRQPTQAGTRSLGRLAFIDNYRAIYRRLEAELQACCSEDTLHELSQHTDVGFRTRVPRVYIVTNLAGATGGGMFVDVAYVMRQMLRRLGYSNAEVVGVFYLPPVGNDPVRMRALANSNAALKELKYFSSGQNVFRARYANLESTGGSIKAFSEAGPPFHRSFVLKLPEPRPGSLNSVRDASRVVNQAGEYIFRDLATSLGRELDARRREIPASPGVNFHSFGLFRLVWPRKQIIEKAARGLCKRLIDRWLSKSAVPLKEEIRNWSQQQWEEQGFRVENLIALHHDKCENLLKMSPDGLSAQIIDPLTDQLGVTRDAAGGERLNIGPVVQAMDQLENLLGIPEECRPKGPTPEPSVIEKALSEAAAEIADNCDAKLAELVVRHLIEEPRFRLAGAEEALRQFGGIAEHSLQAHEQLATELNERTVALYQKIHKLCESGGPVTSTKTAPAQSIWKGPFNRRAPAEKASPAVDLIETLRSFTKCRYQSLVLQHITSLYVSLRGLVSDQMREVGYCRTRLGELAGLIAIPPQLGAAPRGESSSQAGPAPAQEKHLLPEGCADIKDAIEQIDNEIGPEDLLAFDHIVQRLLEQQFQALVHVCMGSSNMVKSLAPALIQEAVRFIEPRLANTNAAEMYLAQSTRGETASPKGAATPRSDVKEDLLNFYAAAAPPFVKNGGTAETAIVTLPAGEAGTRLRNVLHGIVAGAYVLASGPPDEVLFFREQGPLVLEDFEQLGPLGEEAYRKHKSSDPAALHTREDIPEWVS